MHSRSAKDDGAARSSGTTQDAFRCSLSYATREFVWVQASGELDIATTVVLEQVLRGAAIRGRLLVLDLRDLTFIDCCGLHAILAARVRADRESCRVMLIPGSSQVQRMLALTGLVG
jgi:anti-anti-sigma factor